VRAERLSSCRNPPGDEEEEHYGVRRCRPAKLCERHCQTPDSLSNFTFAQGRIPENDACTPWRFYIERIYGVQTHASYLGFAGHIRDHSAAFPLQPNKNMESGIRPANFGPFGELLANGANQCIPSSSIRGVGPAQVTIKVALADEIRESKLL